MDQFVGFGLRFKGTKSIVNRRGALHASDRNETYSLHRPSDLNRIPRVLLDQRLQIRAEGLRVSRNVTVERGETRCLITDSPLRVGMILVGRDRQQAQ